MLRQQRCRCKCKLAVRSSAIRKQAHVKSIHPQNSLGCWSLSQLLQGEGVARPGWLTGKMTGTYCSSISGSEVSVQKLQGLLISLFAFIRGFIGIKTRFFENNKQNRMKSDVLSALVFNVYDRPFFHLKEK